LFLINMLKSRNMLSRFGAWWKMNLKHPWLLIVFLGGCFFASGFGALKNSSCYSSPCGPERVEMVDLHFSAENNVLLVPAMALYRILPWLNEDIRIEPPLFTLFPYQITQWIVQGHGDTVLWSARWIYVLYVGVLFIHIPYWTAIFFALERLWGLRERWARELLIALLIVLILFVCSAWIGSYWFYSTGYSAVTWEVFFDPKSAIFEPG
jgi:hypothetical protein